MGKRALPLVLLGAALGLTWAAALRGYMVEVAGPASSTVDWVGTFGLILAPGLVVGAAFGWAEHLRRTGATSGWRWIAVAPLLFPIAALSIPGALQLFVTSGLGGGSIGVALLGLLGGYALGKRGPLAARIASGALALLAVPGWIIGSLFMGELAVTSARGAWVAVLFFGLMLVLALASSIPHRIAAEGAATSR